MALVAEESFWTLLPPFVGVVATHVLTVLGSILEYFWWSSKVSHVMGVYAALGVM